MSQRFLFLYFLKLNKNLFIGFEMKIGTWNDKINERKK